MIGCYLSIALAGLGVTATVIFFSITLFVYGE
jgi:hypothetical protein